LRIPASQELVPRPIELQWVVDFDLGRAGSPSRPVLGWQPYSPRAARRSAPTMRRLPAGGSEIRPYPPPESNRHSNLGNPFAGIHF